MSLKDKASRINFAGLPGLGATAAEAPQDPATKAPRTAPGQLMQLAASQREELVRKVEDLERQLETLPQLTQQAERASQLEGALAEARAELAQWDGAKGVRLLDATDVTTSRFANRHPDSFGSKDFEALVAEIGSAGGNVQPVKVRPLATPREGARFELVYGHRRLQACRQLGLPVLAMVDNVDDRALFAEMERENRGRQNLSPWEQGVMYRRALDEGLFASMRQMAEMLGANVSAVSRSLALASLPQAVVDAFRSPLELQFRWAKPLTDALLADKDGTLQRANTAKAWPDSRSAARVFDYLVSGTEASKSSTDGPSASWPIHRAGKVVATVRRSESGLSVDWRDGELADAVVERCIEALRTTLEAEPPTGV